MSTLLIIFLIILSVILLFIAGLHLGFRNPKNKEVKTPEDIGIAYQKVSIPTVSNKKLYAWFIPTPDSKETIVILHGWGGNNELMLPLGLPFHQAGMNVLLIDSRGHGHSDSDTFSSLPRFAEDLGKSVDWLKLNKADQSKKIAVLGHSVGAGAVLFETSKRTDIDAVISVSAFAHPKWMMTRWLQSLRFPSFLITVILKYVQWLIGHPFAEIAPLNTVCNINKPVLIVHGNADQIVPIEDAYAIIENCPKSHIRLLEIDGAGHESVDKIEEHSQELINFLDKSGFDLNTTKK